MQGDLRTGVKDEAIIQFAAIAGKEDDFLKSLVIGLMTVVELRNFSKVTAIGPPISKSQIEP